MAGISRDLILVDKFSSVFDNFIKKIEKVASISDKQDAARSSAYSHWIDQTDMLTSAFEGPIGAMDRMMQATQSTTRMWSKWSAGGKEAFRLLERGINNLGVDWNQVAEQADKKMLKLLSRVSKLAKSGKIKLDPSVLKSLDDTISKIRKVGDEAEKSGKKGAKGLSHIEKTAKGLITRLIGVTAIIRAMKASLERVPDDTIRPLMELKSFFADTLARATSAFFKGAEKGMKRLQKALQSPGVQRALKALEVGFHMVGEVIGFLIEHIALLVEWIGNNLQPILMALAGISAVLVGVLMAKAAAWLAVAAAELAAHWPLLLIAAAVVGLMKLLSSLGVTASDVFAFIGSLLGVLYVTAYNVFADIWNVIATFAEFFANVFNNPVEAIVQLFFNLFDTILSVVEDVASLIDKIVGTDWSGAVSSFRQKARNYAASLYGDEYIKLERMEKKSYGAEMDRFSGKGRAFGDKLSNFSLDSMTHSAIKSAASSGAATAASSRETAANTKAIKDAVTDEDLKMLIDVATQKFVSNVNLTAQTPVITINGANTGNTAADRKRLAKDIRDMLVDQIASGSTSGQYAYMGG